MSDKEFEKLLKDAQDKAFKDASKGLTAQDRTQRKNTKDKLKKRNPPFAALRKEVTDAYEGKTKFPSKFKDKKGMREYVKGEGRGTAEAVEEYFGPGSVERLIQGKASKVPINMRGGGVAMRGFGRANYSKKDI